jgi:hypothetical protein
VLFAGDPNFRAFTDGTQKVLYNAVFGDDPAGVTTAAAPVRASSDLAGSSGDVGDDLVVSVRPSAADDVTALLGRYGATASVTRAPGKVTYHVDLGDRTADQHPWAFDAVAELTGLGGQVVSVRVP